MLDLWTRLSALGPVRRPAKARSAVLVPLYQDAAGSVRVILTRRPDTMRTHPGDVVFPGGRMEPGEDPVDTAVREAWEEIGLPAKNVAVVGGLTPVTTRDPGDVIVPVVAKVLRPDEFVIDRGEVDVVLEPTLMELLDETRWRQADWLGYTMWFFDFDTGTMWGATGYMMREFLGVMRGEDAGKFSSPRE